MHINKNKRIPSSNSKTKSKPPSFDSPQRLLNMIICTTGFYPEEEKQIIEKIKEEGGIYKEDLSKKANYLISNKANTQKTREATKQGITIVTKSWIIDKNTDFYLNNTLCKMKCFHNISFSLIGFDSKDQNDLKKMITENNGHINETNNYDSPDIIIIKSNFVLSKSMNDELISKYNKKLTNEKWIYDSISKEKFLDIGDYQFMNNIIVEKYKEIKNNIENIRTNNREQLLLFIDKIFYISSAFDKESYYSLFNLISFFNGIVYKRITPLTDYIVCITKNDFLLDQSNGDGNDNNTNLDISLYTESFKPKKISFNFIFDSIDQKTLLPYEQYPPLDTTPLYLSQSDDIYLNSLNNKYKKKAIISTIFKNELFTICKNSYNEEQYETLCEKIVENSGKLIESSDNIFKDQLGKYVICNDGQAQFISELINHRNNIGNNNIIIVSHRFIDICINKKKIINMNGYYNLYPFNFNVPVEKFKNLKFHIPSKSYTFTDFQRIELLIDTLGGTLADWGKDITHFITNKKTIEKKEYEKAIKFNKDVKIVKEEWLIDFITGTGDLPDEGNYMPEIKDKV